MGANTDMFVTLHEFHVATTNEYLVVTGFLQSQLQLCQLIVEGALRCWKLMIRTTNVLGEE
jgi:hypothetical protein